MTVEFVLSAALGVLCVGWIARNLAQGWSWVTAVVTFCTLMALVWAGGQMWQPVMSEAEVKDRPTEAKHDGYVSSDQCQTCHPREYASWHASWHRTMTQVVTPRTVVADLDSTEVTAYGRRFAFTREGESFWVELDDPDYLGTGKSPRIRRRIVASTGSHFQQEYWYTNGDKRMNFVPLTYLIEQQRFVPFWSVFVRPPLRERLKSNQYSAVIKGVNWEATCVNCHTTRPIPRGPEGPGPPETQLAEYGIACEACHGAGGEHVALNRDPTRRYRLYVTGTEDSTIVNAAKLQSPLRDEVCGQCHSVGAPLEMVDQRHRGQRLGFEPGEPLSRSRYVVRSANVAHDSLMQRTLRGIPDFLDRRFWSDGEVRVSGREYSGMIESPCFQKGHGDRQISCFSCHQLHRQQDDPRSLAQWARHQLKPGARTGPGACLDCHAEFADDNAATKHTRHLPNSSGSRCQNCHMPHTTFGLLKAMRSHRVDSPSVLTTVETGRPHACNLCHLDRSLQWTVDQLAGWDGTRRDVVLTLDQQAVPAALKDALAGDAGQRALAAWAMGWPPAMEVADAQSGWLTEVLLGLLADPYDAVRFVAFESLRRQPGFEVLPPDAFDYVASSRQRAQSIERLRDHWRALNPRKRPGDTVRLAAGDDRDPQSILDSLALQRDDRVVDLDE